MDLIEISVCAEKEVYQIKLTGELDACSSIVLDQVLEEASLYRPRYITIDCQELQYISSAGMGAIIAHLRSYTHHNISLTLCNVQEKVYNICQLVGLHKLITIHAAATDVYTPTKIPIAYHMSSDGDNHQIS